MAVGEVGCRPAAQALRGGRIKLQIRAAAARLKQKIISTVQARRGVRFKTARQADPARSKPKMYFTVLGCYLRTQRVSHRCMQILLYSI